MKAWRIYDFGKMGLDDIPIPDIKPGWVLIKVRMVQPSFTEIQWFQGVSIAGIEKIRKAIDEKAPLQMFGHEFCGQVVDLGPEIKNVKLGDRVVYYRRSPCYKCRLCLSGHQYFCHRGPVLGVDIPGCLAEYVLIPAESLISIPDSISDSEAAVMQPLSAAVADVEVAEIEMGDTVVVFGQGIMGLYLIQLSRLCGAGKVVALSSRDEALAISGQLGANFLINLRHTNTVEAVMDATNGLGADVIFECGGGGGQQRLPDTERLVQALNLVRDEGKIVQIAIVEPHAALMVNTIGMRGIKYLGQKFCSRKLVEYTIDLISLKRIQLVPFITHILDGLEKIPEAFEITGNKNKHKSINPAQVVVSR